MMRYTYDFRKTVNKALHLPAIPLRSIAVGEARAVRRL